MLNSTYEKLVYFLNMSNVNFNLLAHAPCRSSIESATARASAGFPEAIGAKALVVILGEDRKPSIFVLPGPTKIDSKLVRKRFGRMRFATPEELASATGGLEPGMVPPFGRPIFEGISNLYIDERLEEYRTVGFNAACLDKSIVLQSEEYLKVSGATEVLSLSATV